MTEYQHKKKTGIVLQVILIKMGSEVEMKDVGCNYLFYFIRSLPSTVHVPLGITIALLSVISVFFNTSLIASFIATKQSFLNTSNFLVVCLSFAEFVGASIPMPMLAFFLCDVKVKYGCLYENLTLCAMVSLYCISQLLTTIMAIDRYMHMNPNFGQVSRFAKIFDRPYVYVLVLIAIAFSVCNGSLYIISKDMAPDAFAVTNLSFMSFAFAFQLVVTALYIRGYRRIRRFTRNNQVHKNDSGSPVRPAYLNNLFRSVLMLITVSLLSQVPIHAANMAFSILVLKQATQDAVGLLTYLFISFIGIYINSVANCLIIFYHNDEAKDWVVRRLCIPRSREINTTVHNTVAPASHNQLPLEVKLRTARTAATGQEYNE